MTVNTLRKQCHKDEAVLLAKALIKSWKKLLPGKHTSSACCSLFSQEDGRMDLLIEF